MPAKRTHDQFVSLVGEKYPDYKVLSQYKNNMTKVLFCHTTCGKTFEKTPGHFLGGQGCPFCSHETKKAKLAGDNPMKFFRVLTEMGFELVSPNFTYTNCFEKVELRCKTCGRISEKTPANLLRGHGCRYCMAQASQPGFDIQTKLACDAPDWELVGSYVNMKTPTKFRHKKCGMEYSKKPESIFTKPGGCRFCNAKTLRLSHQEYMEKVRCKTDYEICSEYKGGNTRIKVKHLICGKTFWTLPLTFARRQEGCPYCKGSVISKGKTLSHEQFVEALGERAQEFTFLSRYDGAHAEIKAQHKCGYVWNTTPDNLLRRGRCPHCDKRNYGEKELYDYVCSITKCVVKPNDRNILPKRRELDVYLPSLNLAFEYDGLFYHSKEYLSQPGNNRGFTEKEAQNYASWKTIQARRKGVRLVHIYEDEWLYKQDIVKDKIKCLLSVPGRRMFARKLAIKRVPSKQASSFYEANHIQGKARYTVSYGLFNQDTLVAVQSFLKGSRKKDAPSSSWELVRYATKLGTVVVGGFSKCLSHFEKDFSPYEVVSFADSRWCDPDNNVYEKNGFRKDYVTRPSYYYVKGTTRLHKTNFRKNKIKKLFPKAYSPNKTEAELMRDVGFLTIYDCGKIRYVKT